MTKCSVCAIPTENGITAAWNYIITYQPKTGTPIYKSHQGILCTTCFQSHRAWKLGKLSDLKPSPKKKDIVARPQTFDWK